MISISGPPSSAGLFLWKSSHIRTDCSSVREAEERASGWVCVKPGQAGRGDSRSSGRKCKGILSGAAAFETADLQKRLLEHEGVTVMYTPDGWRVDMKKDGWHNTLDEALAFRKKFEELGI